MKNVSALLLVILIAACSGGPKSEYQQLYADFEANQNSETYGTLIEMTLEKIRSEESTDAEKKEALETGFKASLAMDNKGQAIGFLNTFIREYPKDASSQEKLFELGKLLTEIRKEKAATTVLQGYISQYPEGEHVAEAKEMLPEDAATPEEILQQLGQDMFESQQGQLDRQAARNFVDVCEAYALTHPGDPKSADYLHKAAETARAMRTIPKALNLYEWILTDYPEHEKAPQALFLKAFTYDNNLNDVENARKHYEEFLEKYPENDFADDTEFLLENLGKSDEEILEALTKKNQQK